MLPDATSWLPWHGKHHASAARNAHFFFSAQRTKPLLSTTSLMLPSVASSIWVFLRRGYPQIATSCHFKSWWKIWRNDVSTTGFCWDLTFSPKLPEICGICRCNVCLHRPTLRSSPTKHLAPRSLPGPPQSTRGCRPCSDVPLQYRHQCTELRGHKPGLGCRFRPEDKM